MHGLESVIVLEASELVWLGAGEGTGEGREDGGPLNSVFTRGGTDDNGSELTNFGFLTITLACDSASAPTSGWALLTELWARVVVNTGSAVVFPPISLSSAIPIAIKSIDNVFRKLGKVKIEKN